MAVNGYIYLNGFFLRSSEPSLFPNNRAFRYGDSLTENIHACATEPQFLHMHIARLIQHMKILSMSFPVSLSEVYLRECIVKLLNKNRYFGGAAIRLTAFRISEDIIPRNSETGIMLECFPLAQKHYALNEKGLFLDISDQYIKEAGPFSGIKSASPHLYLMAAKEALEKQRDITLLLNSSGKIVETTDSNIFLVSGNSIFTPGDKQGCIPGIMREVVLKICSENGIITNNESNLSPTALFDAEEIFLTNALNGIRWIGAYRHIRYFNKMARFLTGKLNAMAFSTV